MVRLFQERDEKLHGLLVVQDSTGGPVEVSYVPPPIRLIERGLDPHDAKKYATKLLEFDIDTGQISIFPINTVGSRAKYLGPKYKKVRKITLADASPVLSMYPADSVGAKDYARSLTFGPTQPLEMDVEDAYIAELPQSEEQIIEILESLPPAFTKDYDYGLGLAKPYRFIVEAIEDLTDCTEIIVSRDGTTRVDEVGEKFHIAADDFEIIRKMLNTTTRMGQVAGRSVKSAESHNFFAEILDRPLVPVSIGRHRLRKLFTSAMLNDETLLSDEEQEEVIGVISRNMKSISENRPERLVRLQNDIELVNLDVLIDRFEVMLRANHGEPVWQEFFDENPFILSQAFGYPIIKVGQQTSVGGRRLTGKGEKITDFLVKNSLTNNTAVVEIKTPSAKLLKKNQYRSGVFAPSNILTESTIQALDQKYQFERDIFGIRGRSRVDDIETYAVQCCLVIGRIPETEDEKKSFELYRGNSKDVQIVTFDELLQKLVELRDLLVSSEDNDADIAHKVEVPF